MRKLPPPTPLTFADTHSVLLDKGIIFHAVTQVRISESQQEWVTKQMTFDCAADRDQSVGTRVKVTGKTGLGILRCIIQHIVYQCSNLS